MSFDSRAVPEASGSTASAVRRQRIGLTLTVVVGLFATGVSYVGTRDTWVSVAPPADETGTQAKAEPKAGVALDSLAADPAWDIELPVGPHRDEFQASCLICHSARLPLNQPQFGREKWAEIVHKMAAVYGAPLNADDEARVVEYLLAARPPGS